MFDAGKRIKELRENVGLSARKLSKLVELDPSQISKMENGSSNPSLETLYKICSVLRVNLPEFFSTTSIPYSQEVLAFELKQLIDIANRLTPEEQKLVTEFLKIRIK